ncbi:hypothetical protein SBRY_11241 [Actinacidiphila bryophytorum]|uniref:Uncharacterized protein n=1 Tax=Actinacidiphila bryophytorum TaxID=1436133 RepID=A0A9W4E4L3_9ACTN|nr:hypothetical protein SBRY_11241 [Actinacidiphila bryophytorum]
MPCRRWYVSRRPQRESVTAAGPVAERVKNAFRGPWTGRANSSCLALGDESGTHSHGGTRRSVADWGFDGTYPLSRIQAGDGTPGPGAGLGRDPGTHARTALRHRQRPARRRPRHRNPRSELRFRPRTAARRGEGRGRHRIRRRPRPAAPCRGADGRTAKARYIAARRTRGGHRGLPAHRRTHIGGRARRRLRRRHRARPRHARAGPAARTVRGRRRRPARHRGGAGRLGAAGALLGRQGARRRGPAGRTARRGRADAGDRRQGRPGGPGQGRGAAPRRLGPGVLPLRLPGPGQCGAWPAGDRPVRGGGGRHRPAAGGQGDRRGTAPLPAPRRHRPDGERLPLPDRPRLTAHPTDPTDRPPRIRWPPAAASARLGACPPLPCRPAPRCPCAWSRPAATRSATPRPWSPTTVSASR